MSEKLRETYWFTPILDYDESILRRRGVPVCFWGYISATGAPGTEDHDGLGAIYNSREDFVEVMRNMNDGMGVTVIDGRELDTIRMWIGGVDWTEKEESEWIQMMEDANKSLSSYLMSPRRAISSSCSFFIRFEWVALKSKKNQYLFLPETLKSKKNDQHLFLPEKIYFTLEKMTYAENLRLRHRMQKKMRILCFTFSMPMIGCKRNCENLVTLLD